MEFEDDECFYGGESINTDLDMPEIVTTELSTEDRREAVMIGNALVSWVLNA